MPHFLEKLLSPGTRAMMNLRLGHKFSLVSVAFLIPLSVTLYAVVNYANEGISFARQERLGVTYIQAINQTLQPAIELRERAPTSQQTNKEITKIKSVMQRDSKDELRIHASINDLTNAADNDEFIESLMELTDRVADNSNLMLDPELESFYTMMLAVHYSQHQMALSTALRTVLTNNGSTTITNDRLPSIFDAVTRMTMTDESSAEAIQRIADANKSLADALDANQWRTAGNNLLQKTRAFVVGSNVDLAEITSLVDSYEQASYQFNGSTLNALDKLLTARIQRLQTQRNTYLILTLLCLGVSAYLIGGFYLANQRGFEAMITRMNKLAKGNLTLNYPARGSDEIGDLINAFNNSSAELQVLVQRIREAANTINSVGSEISYANMDLAQRSSEQSAVIGETSERVRVIADKINQNLEGSARANFAAEDAHRTAHEGQQIVNGVITTMDAMSNSSKRIGTIIDVINEIAFQTNLLALNAAVEAARAGEQGRGFAVVAGEVRQLAQRCATAANEIGQVIKSSINDVDRGVKQVAHAGESMQGILQSVKTVSDIMSSMQAASKQQTQGMDSVRKAVDHIDADTRQNAALVEQTAAAADLLSQQVGLLMDSVRHFTLGTDVPEVAHPGDAALLATDGHTTTPAQDHYHHAA